MDGAAVKKITMIWMRTFIVALLSSVVCAEEFSVYEEKKEIETQTEQTIVDSSKDWLAEYLNTLSGDLDSFFFDSFFSDDILEDDSKGSKAKLSFYTRRKIGDPVDYTLGLSVKLELPKVHKKLNLIFESETDNGDSPETDVINAAEKIDYSAALRFMIQETKQWKANIDAGVRWQLPPDPFTRLRIRRYADLPYDINLRATQEFSWYQSEGLGSRTAFRFDRQVGDKRLLRWGSSAKYLLENDYFELSSSITLFHELNTKEALAYTISASGDDKESATFYDYSIGVRFRRQVYRDWMFAEIAPEIISNREDNYDLEPVLMFRFEALIAQ